MEYSRANIAKVNIFLKDPYVKRYIRGEMISEFNFVGTIGGLLGLFMGFSFLSAVEVVYLCILGLFGHKKSIGTKDEENIFQISSSVMSSKRQSQSAIKRVECS